MLGTYLLREEGGRIFDHPAINPVKVRALLSTPTAFVSMCTIFSEQEERYVFLEPTPEQLVLLEAIHEHPWVMVNKYRQAKMTTVAVLWLLRDCMYIEGLQGVLVACDRETAEQAFERLVYAYEHLPDDVRMPLRPRTRGSTRKITFCHGGSIRIITAAKRAPAIGHSIDRLVITEWGEAPWQKRAVSHIFPTISRRRFGRVILESTPGYAGSHHEAMWQLALEGKSRFYPVFHRWWLDRSCWGDIPDDVQSIDEFMRALTRDERELLAKMQRLSPQATKRSLLQALAYRRKVLMSEFAGDTRLWEAKYPSDEYSGWLGHHHPVLPQEVIRDLLARAIPDAKIPLADSGCHEIDPPSDGMLGYVLVTADPAGFGASGDPSAVTVWDARYGQEVAFWSGREDPARFAERLLRICARYAGVSAEVGLIDPSLINVPFEHLPLLVVESNATACIALLRSAGYRRLFFSTRHHAGWYADARRLREAEGFAVEMLREGTLRPRSKGGLHQLLSYDGTNRPKHGHSIDGETHHFDRARTIIIAAGILHSGWPHRRPEEPEPDPWADPKPKDYPEGTMPVKLIEQFLRGNADKVANPFEPISNLARRNDWSAG